MQSVANSTVAGSTSDWQFQSVDEGILAFDRRSGLNVLARNEGTRDAKRIAPRSLQVGLLTPCNLACSFCYRDMSAPSRLTASFLVDLLTKSADWGVLEVAFGGGEPLLFPDFVPLIRGLHERTPLGVNFTTNGLLLTAATADELKDTCGEIRVSAYDNNRYRQTVRMLAAGAVGVGVNQMVTPGNVGLLEPIVRDCLDCGADNVLLLGYKGADPSLHLGPADRQRLRDAVHRMEHLPIRLDICWHPHLVDLPQLFPRSDCGAGDELLVITPDRAVQPCSFHHERIPFETFDELKAIYADLRRRRPAANVLGCTRPQFVNLSTRPVQTSTGVWAWSARSSNNSGDWTIVGRFQDATQAVEAAELLRQLSRAHEAFLASIEGQVWLDKHTDDDPSPPMQQFGADHGFRWTKSGTGLSWEENAAGAPVLTAGAVGDCVVVYHRYCMELPEVPFREFLIGAGAKEFYYAQSDRPNIVATARGKNPAAIDSLRAYHSLFHAAEYPSDVQQSPPWGEECVDSRLLDDEDRSARLERGPQSIEEADDSLRLQLTFANTFAGAIALEKWLRDSGFRDVSVAVDSVLPPIQGRPARKQKSKTKAKRGQIETLASRIVKMTPEQLMETYFAIPFNPPPEVVQAIAKIPADERLSLARQCWERLRPKFKTVDDSSLSLIQDAGHAAADWMRELWRLWHEEGTEPLGRSIDALRSSLPPDELLHLAEDWLSAAPNRKQLADRLFSVCELGDCRLVPHIERWWSAAPPNAPITGDWGRAAADARVDWPTLRRWLETGRPLSLLALDALLRYDSIGVPDSFNHPTLDDFLSTLQALGSLDRSPRVQGIIRALIASTGKFVRPPEGSAN